MPNAGHIYILVNPSHKLLKIGKTTKTPEERAAELSSTGVPAPFMVAYFEKVSDCDLAEVRVHTELAAFRVNGDREFFSVALKSAIKVVSKVAEGFQIGDLQPRDLQTEPLPNEQKIKDAVNVLMALGVKQDVAHNSICAAQLSLGATATIEDLVQASLKKSK